MSRKIIVILVGYTGQLWRANRNGRDVICGCSIRTSGQTLVAVQTDQIDIVDPNKNILMPLPNSRPFSITVHYFYSVPLTPFTFKSVV